MESLAHVAQEFHFVGSEFESLFAFNAPVASFSRLMAYCHNCNVGLLCLVLYGTPCESEVGILRTAHCPVEVIGVFKLVPHLHEVEILAVNSLHVGCYGYPCVLQSLNHIYHMLCVHASRTESARHERIRL